jgi:hypothetical protein
MTEHVLVREREGGGERERGSERARETDRERKRERERENGVHNLERARKRKWCTELTDG